MENDAKIWESIEFNDVQDFGDLYQNLSVFKYNQYLEDIGEVIRKKRIIRQVNGNSVILQFKNRQISYCIQLPDGTATIPVKSEKIPRFFFSPVLKNKLILLLASAEVNARVNLPRTAAEFQPLELPEIFFSN